MPPSGRHLFDASTSHSLDKISVTFDDDHAVANAGLIQPATLAQHLGLRELFDSYLDLGAAPGHANVGLKAMTSCILCSRVATASRTLQHCVGRFD